MSYANAWADYKWNIPARYNIGVAVCDKWADADPDRPAIIEVTEPAVPGHITSFSELRLLSNQLANMLVSLGLERGDRVAVLAPQRLETALAHIAVYKAGAIAVPLFSLFGPDALQHRLSDSGARFLIADDAGLQKVSSICSELPELVHLVSIDQDADGFDLLERISLQDAEFDCVDTFAEDPAIIIYTSGTTGPSKGALHAHRVLLGHLPGVEMSHDGFPQSGDRIWTPADWAWIGGLFDVLLPALHHGVAVIACRFSKFDAESAFELISSQRVRNLFLPPTALRLMRAVPDASARWPLNLRSVASGGEALGEELIAWGRNVLGTTINEFYGQTECNMVLSSCAAWFPTRPGFIGRPVPGHIVAIVDEFGRVLPPGKPGQIAIKQPDPVMFIGYWNQPEASADRFIGEWLLTGDMATTDEEGYFRFLGREDDLITSSGYRIGPSEIEDCLLRHPAVQSAGVVGAPDPERTEVVVAFVVPSRGTTPDSSLTLSLQKHVRTHLGAHQYPRQLHYLHELPTTATGKIMRRSLRAMLSGTSK